MIDQAKLGILSERYESNGDPGCVSDGQGDAGGISYGCYQLSSNAGSLDSFILWLKAKGSAYGNMLSEQSINTEGFIRQWKEIANIDPVGFKQLQHDYIGYAYYEPAIKELKSIYFNIEKHSNAMANVIWSRAVQYGVGNIAEMFQEANKRAKSLSQPNLSYIDDIRFDADLIRSIYYNVCRTEEWTGGSPSLREGLYQRFADECADALEMLKGEIQSTTLG